MTSENNKAHLLYQVKLCASFQTGVTVWIYSIKVKISICLSHVTLKFDRWPWKTIRHLFYTTLGSVHHFKAMGEFKLELQSRNSQFDFFLYRVTLQFNGWPRKTIRHIFYTTLSTVHHFKACSEFKLELESASTQFGWKATIFCPVWPWNLMDDLEK